MNQAATVAISILSSVIAGGGIGWAVALAVARKESRDRLSLLNFQREQWTEAAEREHAQWLREKRYEAYAAVLEAHSEYFGTAEGATTMNTDFTYVTKLVSAANRAQTIATPETSEAIRKHMQEFGVYANLITPDPSQIAAFGAKFDVLRKMLNQEVTRTIPSQPSTGI